MAESGTHECEGSGKRLKVNTFSHGLVHGCVRDTGVSLPEETIPVNKRGVIGVSIS